MGPAGPPNARGNRPQQGRAESRGFGRAHAREAAPVQGKRAARRSRHDASGAACKAGVQGKRRRNSEEGAAWQHACTARGSEMRQGHAHRVAVRHSGVVDKRDAPHAPPQQASCHRAAQSAGPQQQAARACRGSRGALTDRATKAPPPAHVGAACTAGHGAAQHSVPAIAPTSRAGTARQRISRRLSSTAASASWRGSSAGARSAVRGPGLRNQSINQSADQSINQSINQFQVQRRRQVGGAWPRP